MKKTVQIQDVGQSFDTKKGRFVALRDIQLDIHEGESIALIGHSGCGKSTLLNLIAGLTTPSTGVMLCDGREIAGPGPERAVVFQNWLTCYDNVYLAVERVFGRKEGRASLKQRTHDALALVGLSHAETKFPHEISGGMKQRPCAVDAAARAADGRALRRPRCADPRPPAGRADEDPVRHRRDDGDGHA